MKKIQNNSIQFQCKLTHKLITHICLFVVLFSMISCDKQNDNDKLISEILINGIAERHINNRKLVRERLIDSLNNETEYVFTALGDSISIFITIAILESAKEAENEILETLKYVAIIMEEGPHNKMMIGDKFWWHAFSNDSTILSNICFVRKNASFKLSCSHGYKNLETIAKNIDDDIINEESYIIFK